MQWRERPGGLPTLKPAKPSERLTRQAREAKRGADAQVRESKRAEAAASKLTDSVEKAAKKASDSQAREAKKASDASAAAAQNSLAAARKFADDAAKAYEKSAARTEAAEMRATAARAKAVGAAANKAVAETEKATQAQVTSAQRSTRAEEARVARLIGLGKEQLSQTEVGMRAAAIVNQKVQQDRVNAAAKAMSGESKSWLSSIDLSGKATSAVAGFVGGLVAVNGVVSVVGSIAAEFDKVAEKAFLAAQKVAGYRNELRSLAGLEGQAGPTDVTMLKQLDLRLATGATAGQATAFSNEYLGAGQAALDTGPNKTDRKISQKDFDALGTYSLDFGTAGGVDASTMGKLAGGLPLLSKGHTTLDQQKAQLFQAKLLLDPGEGSFSSLSAQVMGQAGALVGTGLAKDPGELFAMGSVLSHAGPDKVGTRLTELARLTRGFDKESGKPGTEMSQAAWLKDIGADESMTIDTIVNKMVDDVEKKEAIAKKTGTPFAVDTYLADKNVRNIEDRLTFAAYYSYRNERKALQPILDKPPTTADAQKYVDAAAETDAGQSIRAVQQKETAELLRGRKTEKAQILVDRATAAQDIGGSEESAGTGLLDWFTGMSQGHFLGPSEYGKRTRMSEEVEDHFFKLAEKNKIKFQDVGLNAADATTYAAMDPNRMSGIAKQFQDRGIDPFAGLGKTEELLKEIRDTLKNNQAGAPRAPAPLGAGPPGGMRRPNAGP